MLQKLDNFYDIKCQGEYYWATNAVHFKTSIDIFCIAPKVTVFIYYPGTFFLQSQLSGI